MADKKYKLTFEMSDGSSQNVQFTAPQGPKGDIDDFIYVGDTEPSSGPILWFNTATQD